MNTEFYTATSSRETYCIGVANHSWRFRISKWLDTNTDLTRTLTIFGTPGYIAPEQAKGPAAELTQWLTFIVSERFCSICSPDARLSWRTRSGRHSTGQRKTGAAIAHGRADTGSRLGNDLRVAGARATGALSRGKRFGCRSRTLAGRAPDHCTPRLPPVDRRRSKPSQAARRGGRPAAGGALCFLAWRNAGQVDEAAAESVAGG